MNLGCLTRKVQYGTRREASVVLKRLATGENGMRPYCCGLCGLWHLGHATKLRELKRARRRAA